MGKWEPVALAMLKRPASTLQQRLDERVQRGTHDECWPWIGTVNKNSHYGTFTANRDGTAFTLYAHRLAWIATNGLIPAGYTIDHRCENRLCCNPAHMLLATLSENSRRGSAKRFVTLGDETICRHGHVGERVQVSNGKWYCRACHRVQNQRRRHPS